MSHPVTKTSYCVQLKQFKTQSKLRDWDNWLCMQPTSVYSWCFWKYIRNTFEIHRKTAQKWSKQLVPSEPKDDKKKIPVWFPRTHLALLDALQLFLLGELTFLVSSFNQSALGFIMCYHYPIYHTLSTIEHMRSILEAYFIIILITIPFSYHYPILWKPPTVVVWWNWWSLEDLKLLLGQSLTPPPFRGGQKRPVANYNGDQHFAELPSGKLT